MTEKRDYGRQKGGKSCDRVKTMCRRCPKQIRKVTEDDTHPFKLIFHWETK